MPSKVDICAHVLSACWPPHELHVTCESANTGLAMIRGRWTISEQMKAAVRSHSNAGSSVWKCACVGFSGSDSQCKSCYVAVLSFLSEMLERKEWNYEIQPTPGVRGRWAVLGSCFDSAFVGREGQGWQLDCFPGLAQTHLRKQAGYHPSHQTARHNAILMGMGPWQACNEWALSFLADFSWHHLLKWHKENPTDEGNSKGVPVIQRNIGMEFCTEFIVFTKNVRYFT